MEKPLGSVEPLTEAEPSAKLAATMNPILARRRQFSTAHLYEQKAFTPEQNREVFGACYSKYGHGHNYTLEIFVEGPIDAATGIIVNVTDLDIVLKKVCEPFDHKHISFEHPHFRDHVSTTEALASWFYTEVAREIAPPLKLQRVRLYETEDIWATARPGAVDHKGVEITREFVIRSMHHLENASWTPAENHAFYGMCYGLHGHDYHVQVTVGGTLDERTGLVVDRDALDRLIEGEIRSKYDGVNLNKRFKNTSCEQLAIEFYDILKPLVPDLRKVGIQETRKNYFEFPPVG